MSTRKKSTRKTASKRTTKKAAAKKTKARSSKSKKRAATSQTSKKTGNSGLYRGHYALSHAVIGSPGACLDADYDCLVLGVHSKGKLPAITTQVDKAADGAIRKLVKRGDHDGSVGTVATLYDVPNVSAPRIMLVGLGNESDMGDANLRKAVIASVKALKKAGLGNAATALAAADYGKTSIGWRVRQAVDAADDSLYSFTEMQESSKGSKARKSGLTGLDFVVSSSRQVKAAEQALVQGAAIAKGASLTRDLGNRPANICTPTHLAEQATKLGKEHGLKVSIYDEARMRKLKMNTLLSVSAGSREEARLIVMEYNGGRKGQAPVALVGKGITFDTGGISLKPGGSMDEMKFDMCGAASVFGTMSAIASMNLKLNVVGIVAAAENMPSGTATKPGDVIESMKGLTVEILNTDAEGRLVLCDALTFTERFKPSAVVDIATLTGACVIALGSPATGLFSNNQGLADELLEAGDTSGDRAWQMPVWDEYQPQLKSNFADMANIGGREAGAVTAACFLSRFADKYPWAHLDIAGTAWKKGAAKGATGRPVRLLTQFLMSRAGHKS